MKNFSSPTYFILMCLFGLSFLGCEKDVDTPKQTYSPQLSSATCGHLAVEDLDLSAGFQGVHRRMPKGSGIDFSIAGHSPEYPFPPSAQAGDECSGYCSIRILFEPASEAGVPSGLPMGISDLTLDYTSAGTTISESLVDYEWNYPELFIYDIYANTIMDYHVTFESTTGDYLAIAMVDVVGGLCVIENVDEEDPVYITSRDPNNNSGN